MVGECPSCRNSPCEGPEAELAYLRDVVRLAQRDWGIAGEGHRVGHKVELLAGQSREGLEGHERD